MTCESVPAPVAASAFAYRYTDCERALFHQQNETADLLAEALGYPRDPEYGWLIGDHTIVTLAMEARRRGLTLDGPAEFDPGVDLSLSDAAFIAVRAAYRAWAIADPHTDVAHAAFWAWAAASGVSRRLSRIDREERTQAASEHTERITCDDL